MNYFMVSEIDRLDTHAIHVILAMCQITYSAILILNKNANKVRWQQWVAIFWLTEISKGYFANPCLVYTPVYSYCKAHKSA